MNEAPANLLGLAGSRPPGESWPAGPKRSEGWSRKRWLVVIALVFAAHVALVFLFGGKKQIVPRAVANIPTLSLADDSDELLALNDPTLFALPHRRDFAAAVWLKMPDVKPPSFRYTESPRLLPFSADKLGAAFVRLMQADFSASPPLDFKPALALSTPSLPVEPVLAQNSTMQVEGELAQRQLPAQISLTNWPFADVLQPCVVQVLVDAAGNVISTVVLTPSGYDDADQRALAIARSLRFTPSTGLTIGRITFNWHTVPPATINNGHE
ncbi:MAG: TonB family protein [Verrucomicrobiales bacterium]|nr:TonB family protein [Verrucomicrobiales bacterium]